MRNTFWIRFSLSLFSKILFFLPSQKNYIKVFLCRRCLISFFLLSSSYSFFPPIYSIAPLTIPTGLHDYHPSSPLPQREIFLAWTLRANSPRRTRLILNGVRTSLCISSFHFFFHRVSYFLFQSIHFH